MLRSTKCKHTVTQQQAAEQPSSRTHSASRLLRAPSVTDGNRSVGCLLCSAALVCLLLSDHFGVSRKKPLRSLDPNAGDTSHMLTDASMLLLSVLLYKASTVGTTNTAAGQPPLVNHSLGYLLRSVALVCLLLSYLFGMSRHSNPATLSAIVSFLFLLGLMRLCDFEFSRFLFFSLIPHLCILPLQSYWSLSFGRVTPDYIVYGIYSSYHPQVNDSSKCPAVLMLAPSDSYSVFFLGGRIREYRPITAIALSQVLEYVPLPELVLLLQTDASNSPCPMVRHHSNAHRCSSERSRTSAPLEKWSRPTTYRPKASQPEPADTSTASSK